MEFKYRTVPGDGKGPDSVRLVPPCLIPLLPCPFFLTPRPRKEREGALRLMEEYKEIDQRLEEELADEFPEVALSRVGDLFSLHSTRGFRLR